VRGEPARRHCLHVTRGEHADGQKAEPTNDH
jgi:hypothetical protein